MASGMRTERFRRSFSASVISIACHLMIVMAFFWSGNSALQGQASRSLDGSIVDGDAAALPIDLSPPGVGGEARLTRNAPSQITASASVMAPSIPEPGLSDVSRPADAESVQPSAAMPADTLADGRSDADQHILDQIARCLPAGIRPALSERLTLQLDAQGNLAAAPSLERFGTDENRASLSVENTVVQAALQCGPYVVPNGGGSFTIAADFSHSSAAQ